jgi:hypothetical protein
LRFLGNKTSRRLKTIISIKLRSARRIAANIAKLPGLRRDNSPQPRGTVTNHNPALLRSLSDCVIA